jgi:hypothetical protein
MDDHRALCVSQHPSLASAVGSFFKRETRSTRFVNAAQWNLNHAVPDFVPIAASSSSITHQTRLGIAGESAA